MRAYLVAFAVLLLASSAMAEQFHVTDTQIITHRGSDVVLNHADVASTFIDKSNTFVCSSVCSVVIQTQTLWDTSFSATLCTLIDSVPADPACKEFIPAGSDVPYTTFQGKPALPAGTHTIRTQLRAPFYGHPIHLTSFQLVYAIYQH